MKLTPLDIHHKEFHRAIRGYNEEEVDKFLDEVAEEFERVFKESIELKEQLEKAKLELDGYQGMEKTLQNTLL
ncbi:MAG: DivIVA domain-containing protein, partial [Actinomycetota bacterium]|nr:DivIVA domain-containing protein [Actinomycetota bacterium]